MNAARASILALLLCFATAALALVAVPPLSGRVVDQTGTLGADDVASLTQRLRDLETRKGSQIAVLIVPTTDGEALEPFSLRVAETWKIGRKKIDDGALLIVARNDRKLRIEVGYGLEGALTDATTKRIIDEDITPKFKTGDFAGGISAGVDRMIRIVNGEKLPEPEPPHWQDSQSFNPDDLFNPLLLVPAVLLGGILRGLLGRLLGSTAAGLLTALIAWFLVSSVLVSVIAGAIAAFVVLISDGFTSAGPGGRSSSSSGGSWSSGSSSSSSGGFSGGGGSFGGGGASGSW
ncbi:MAG: YgcG family protein [bacterium]|nr:YgcG family protein [bacterium]